MNKKIFALAPFLMVLAALFSSIAYALDVSIDTVKVNGEVLAESKTNLLQDTNNLDVVVSLTAIKDLSSIHAEAVLTDLSTGNTVSDSTGNFILKANQNSLVALNLRLIDALKRQKDFRLEIKVVDLKGNEEKKSFGIKFTGVKAGAGKLDASIDRVIINEKVVAASRTNFIDESNDFDVLVEFTALNDMEDAHVEAILKDLRSGTVVADASSNFDLGSDSSSSKLLRLELLDKLKQSNSFELTVRIATAEGNSIQQAYGIKMRNGIANGANGRAIDVSIDSVEVENKVIAENENNFIIIGEDEKELGLKVRLTSLENAKNAHVDAILAFENGDVVADATTTFDIGKGENDVKKLDLPLIGKFEQNNFKLKVRVVDAEGSSEEKVYGLKISQKRFPFVVSSIALSPETNAEAGKAIGVRVSFRNSGVVPLEGVTAIVSIPELGISSTKFVDQIKNSMLPEAKEYFMLKILDNAPTGTYTVRAEIVSQFGGESEVKEIPVFVIGKSDQAKQTVNEKLVVNIATVRQDIRNDGSEAIYPLTLTNEGPDANTYTLLLDGASWANLRLGESNAFVIKPKESKTINVYASSKGNAKGEQIFLVTIKSGDKVLKQIPLKGNVVAVKGALAAKLKNALEITLIGFAAFLVAAGFFFGVRRYFQGEKGVSEEIPEQEQGEAYY